MSHQLPKYIDLVLFAEKGRDLDGEIQLSTLSRLQDMLIENSGSVNFALSFAKQGRLMVLHGSIKAMLKLQCQSCLQIMDWPIHTTFKLGIVATMDEANTLPDDYDPLLIGEEKIALKDIIEEELLLSVPAFPKHETNCFTLRQKNDISTIDAQPAPGNPFSVLAKLKKTGEK
jgi:DUF177 domain-containing protein